MRRENDNTFYKKVVALATKILQLNRLYKNKEIHKNNENFECTSENDDKIRNLELVMEMFNRGILKEKRR